MHIGRWFGCLWIVGFASWSMGAQEPRTVDHPAGMLVLLLPRTSVAEPLVRIGDVAELQGGSAVLRNKVAALDLAALNAAQPAATLTKDQVYFRLRLAGLDDRQFRLSGATRSVVQWEGAAAERDKIVPATSLTARSPEQPAVLRPRDPVRLVVRIGPVQVTARGEAQEEARLGQIVRVRNTDSGKVVAGRFVERNVVEVDY